MKNSRHKKTPSVRARGVSGNEINYQEEIVMANSSTAPSNVIPFDFRGHSVRAVSIDGEPWFVASDVCRVIDVSNTTQAMQALDDDERSMFNIGRQGEANIVNESGLYTLILRSRDAVRKGSKPHAFRKWVTAEVLPTIRKFGRYHDDEAKIGTLIGETIGTDGFHMLGAVVKGKVSGLPIPAKRRAIAKIWSQTHAAFGVRSAADIPADKLDSARNFIAAYVVLEGDYISRNPAKPNRLNIHFPIQALADRRQGMLMERGEGQAWLDVSLQDVGYHHESLCELIIFELQKAGYVVDAAQWELATYRNKLRGIDSFVRGLNRVVEDPHRYAVEVGAA
ncbi:Bro-N domain-containing protein [Pseudomonas sp. ACN5]|uniref:BRO-N domain-containing protein n=1 Tax=Pseudomonas sp. ACN5 TaxID=1920427 RepID=UPI0021141F08|nr:Bro-N domain-containing protein [Pseudomonas sp. ACN5]PBJ02112.1 hypothetical protein BSF40_52110 [Pseudomonas sp. ACN5]